MTRIAIARMRWKSERRTYECRSQPVHVSLYIFL
jgi:hypothetical protein